MLCTAGAAQAQIKAGIPPKPKSVIEAERTARIERENAKQMAQAAERGHDEAFARLDTDGNGRLSPDEFKEARLESEARRAPTEPHAAQR